MANPIFGEARAVLSDKSELTFRYDFAALCAIEEAAHRGFEDINQEMTAAAKKGGPSVRMATMRAVLFGGLQYHHPDISLADAGDLMMSDGESVTKAMQAAMDAMSSRMGANPRKGAAKAPAPSRGTGTRSTKAGARRG